MHHEHSSMYSAETAHGDQREAFLKDENLLYSLFQNRYESLQKYLTAQEDVPIVDPEEIEEHTGLVSRIPYESWEKLGKVSPEERYTRALAYEGCSAGFYFSDGNPRDPQAPCYEFVRTNDGRHYIIDKKWRAEAHAQATQENTAPAYKKAA
jgi:hypothetical protein